MSKPLQLGEQHVGAGEPIVKKERKRTGERSHVDFCSFEVTSQCRFFTFSLPLCCSFPYLF